MAHFKEIIRICEDQRYEGALPWLAGHPPLYDKYDAAESRLRTAAKHLINENYFEVYDNVFKQFFGVSSSPFMLNVTISYHLERENFQTESLRKIIGHLKEGFYLDNLATSVNDVTELEQLKSQSIEIMKEGAFELRCGASNDSKEDQDIQMILVLSWDVVSDELSCKLPSNLDYIQERSVTKRLLLSVINSVYDPIGCTAPALLLPMLLMQEAWRGKIGWDEVLPIELEHKYRLWEKTMRPMSKCTIPR
ncbi:uncharacterized protein TNIN_59301 [Trichonephila inaurata madagascariensis]|uniref:Uncharacterized protein n=1 Tax=Trichonephila inaurata madagascariensis TaxID=2747483 RepID=A0A8X6YCE5_9ARAC|nr:uncharacterized protein TNIN_59301 [Trichonephila inaurata madagascariensis]